MLASVLGMAVVASVWSVLAMLRASEQRSADRAEGLRQLVQLQTALGSSFRTLVMTDKPVRQPGGGGGAAGAAKAGASGAGANGAPGGGAGGANQNAAESGAVSRGEQMRATIEARREAAASTIEARRNAGREARGEGEEGPPPMPPRLVLDFDRERRLPHLEMVTSVPPVAVQGADGARAFVSPEDHDGVRGAFEIEPGRKSGTYDVWYRAYDSQEGTPEDGRRPIGEQRVASGLTRFNVVFYKTVEGRGLIPLDFTSPDSAVEPFNWRSPPGDFDASGWARTPAARHYNHLPAYVEVEAETWQGLRARWMFEVKWIITRAADTAGGKNGKDGRTAGGSEKPAAGSGTNLLPDGRPATELFGPDGRRR